MVSYISGYTNSGGKIASQIEQIILSIKTLFYNTCPHKCALLGFYQFQSENLQFRLVTPQLNWVITIKWQENWHFGDPHWWKAYLKIQSIIFYNFQISSYKNYDVFNWPHGEFKHSPTVDNPRNSRWMRYCINCYQSIAYHRRYKIAKNIEIWNSR